jgi:L-lactate dehydrogenase complex protein LldE
MLRCSRLEPRVTLVMRVGFFVTCLVDLMRPSIGFAALKLLESGGADVLVPPAQTCCGQPAYNSGDRADTIALARKLVAEFENCDYLVSPSGSCSGMIKTHYAELFADDPPMQARVQRLGARTFELTDFLASVLKLESVPGTFAGKVTYHDCCAGLREMGVKAQPRMLLGRMPGVRLAEMAESETCCGFGGTFSIKFGEISSRLADNKCQHVLASGADALVMGDLGCMLNIEGRLRRCGDTKTKVLHVAEVLAGEDLQS